MKASALLNLWWRKKEGKTIYASQEDIEVGFGIWEEISISQELNLPPYILNLYREVIIPAFLDKNGTSFKDEPEGMGISRKEVMKKHQEVYGRTVPDWTLRQEIIPMLESSGLIYQEPDPDDKRRMLIFPNDFEIIEKDIVSSMVG